MENTAAAARTVYGVEDKPLPEQINEYLNRTRTSIATLAKEINYSRPTVSRYLSGKYDSSTEDIEVRLAAYLSQRTGAAVQAAVPGSRDGRTPAFFEGRDAKTVLGVCQAAQEYREMGIIIGRSGYGKTYALKNYAKLPKVAYIECDVTMTARDLLKELERALKLRTVSNGNHDQTIHERMNRIIDMLVANPGYLLIVDEADKLMRKYSYSKMDILRAIFDRASGPSGSSACGLVIAGEPMLEALIKTHLSQYANRTLLGATLQGLTGAEVERYLSGYEIVPDALEELKSRALNARTGCFRLLDRTLRNVDRILEERQDKTITRKIIREASSLMMV